MAARSSSATDFGVLVWALAWDQTLGDFPAPFDPNEIMSQATEGLENNAPQNSQLARGAYGWAAALLFPYAVWTVSRWLLAATSRVPVAIHHEVGTILLKSTFSVRSLLRDNGASTDLAPLTPAVPATNDAPEHVAIAEGHVAEHLTGLARGFSSNVVGPLFYFALWGVPGALTYRAVRIMSGRWGRDATDPLSASVRRVEQIASFVPTRLSAFLLALAARVRGGDWRPVWQMARSNPGSSRRDPNAGWTEGALAAGLRVRLDAPDEPIINPEGRPAGKEDLNAARKLIAIAAGGAAAGALVVVAFRSALLRR